MPSISPCDEVIKKQQGRKALILLTDGVDHGSKYTLSMAIESAQRADTMVYSVLFSDPHGYGNNNYGPMMGPGMGRRRAWVIRAAAILAAGTQRRHGGAARTARRCCSRLPTRPAGASSKLRRRAPRQDIRRDRGGIAQPIQHRIHVCYGSRRRPNVPQDCRDRSQAEDIRGAGARRVLRNLRATAALPDNSGMLHLYLKPT